jgi:selenide, water dikinase
LHGAAELIAQRVESTLAPDNRLAEAEMEAKPALRAMPGYAALFDPQTSGGLLVGLAPRDAERLVGACREACGDGAALIGLCRDQSPTTARLRIR